MDQAEERFSKIRYVLTGYFNDSAIIEETKQKDISCFSFQDIVDYYKSLSTKSIDLLMNINSQLKLYTDWCIKEEISHHNYFCEIDRLALEKCINIEVLNKGIISREEMLDLLRSPLIRNACDKFLIIALFEGICGREYCELLEASMNNFKDMIADFSEVDNRSFPVSAELVEVARESANEMIFYRSDGKAIRYLSDDNRCIKKWKKNSSERNEAYVIIAKLKQLKETLNRNCISRGNLLESGRIDMIKKYMREENISAEEVLSSKYHRKEIEFRYGAIQVVASYCRKYKEALNR